MCWTYALLCSLASHKLDVVDDGEGGEREKGAFPQQTQTNNIRVIRVRVIASDTASHRLLSSSLASVPFLLPLL